MVLSQSLFQRQHRLHVSDSFLEDICLILETDFGSAIQYLETLEPSYYLFKQQSTHVSPPSTSFCGCEYIHAHTFPKQEASLCQKWMEFRFPEGILGLQLQ